jgi:hypothetical protein
MPVQDPDSLSRAWEWVTENGKVVKCSPCDTEAPVVEMVSNPNLLAHAVYTAFYEHYPLRLSPSVIWITILHGFCRFVYCEPEPFRFSFVKHQGKKELELFLPEFMYGSPENDWARAVKLMGDKIETEVGSNIRDLTQCTFSTASETDYSACQFMLMNLCQSYFKYTMRAGCGIPYIELLGSPEDWKMLDAKVNNLSQFENEEVKDFSTWVADLKVLTSHFVLAAEGKPDLCFWGSICNLMGGSGSVGSPMTGWISILFPTSVHEHLTMFRANPNPSRMGYRSKWSQAYEYAKEVGVETALSHLTEIQGCRARDQAYGGFGLSLDRIPAGVESCPVLYRWDDIGRKENLEFYAGLVSMHQQEDGALEVKSGWAVIHRSWEGE